MSVRKLPSGEAVVSLTATATFNPKPGRAFANFYACTTLGLCTGHTGTVEGGGPTYTAKTDIQVGPGSYKVTARWEGNGLAYTGLRVESSPTPFSVDHWNQNIKDNLKSALIGSAATALLSCGGTAAAAAFTGPAAVAVGKFLVPICISSLAASAGTGVALLYDPPDSAFTAVAVPTAVLSSAPPSASCTTGAACEQLAARFGEYLKALQQTASIAVALGKTTNRMMTADQQGDQNSVRLQLNASKVLYGQHAEAIDAERAAAQRLAQSLKDNGTSLTGTDAQLQGLLQDGAWIENAGQDAKAALASMYLDKAAVLEILSKARAFGSALTPALTDWSNALKLAAPTTAMRDWSRQIASPELAAVLEALRASGELDAGIAGQLTATVGSGCADQASKQRALALVNGLTNQHLKQYLTVGITNLSASGVTPSPTCSALPTRPTASATATDKLALPAGSLALDGGFEPGNGVSDEARGYRTVSAGKPAEARLGAWQVVSGCIDLVDDPVAAREGTQFVDLNGNCGNEGAVLEQTIRTVPNHTYEVTFSLAGNANGDPPVKNVQVQFGGESREFTFDTKGHRPDDLGWTVETFTVDVSGDTTVLRFRSTTNGIRGPLIDRVSILDKGPYRSLLWLWLLAGLIVAAAAVIGWLWWRRRKHATPPPVAESATLQQVSQAPAPG